MIYKCDNCSFVLHIEVIHKHQVHHKFLRNASFVCNNLNCGLKFVKYFSFKAHLIRHRTIKSSVKKNSEVTCELCKCKFGNKYLLIPHFNIHLKQNESIKCPFSCGLPFHNRSSFSSHLCRKHPDLLNTFSKESIIENVSLDKIDELVYDGGNETDDSDDCALNISTPEDFFPESEIPDGINTNPIVKAYGDSILTLSTKHFVANKTIQFMVDSTSHLTSLYQCSLKDKIEEVLTNNDLDNNITVELRKSILEAIKNDTTFSSMFDEKFGIFRSHPYEKKILQRKIQFC